MSLVSTLAHSLLDVPQKSARTAKTQPAVKLGAEHARQESQEQPALRASAQHGEPHSPVLALPLWV
jgi:hypothetical protein